MWLSMRERGAVVNATATREQEARKKERTLILDEITRLTGYSRSYAARILTNWQRVLTVGVVGGFMSLA